MSVGVNSVSAAPVPWTDPSDEPTRLTDLPADATLTVWRKPIGKTIPVDAGLSQIGALIPNTGTYLFICIADMIPKQWETMRALLAEAVRFGAHPVLMGAQGRNHFASALWAVGDLAGLHTLTDEPSRPSIFAPSQKLSETLSIKRDSRIRNALILIRAGHVIERWVASNDEGSDPHDWYPMTKHLTHAPD